MPAPLRPRAKRTAALGVVAPVLAALLCGCVVVPRTTERYDADCRTVAKQVELEVVQIAAIRGCSGRECGVLLAAAGATAAVSAVVSGSIAVAGNVVYWLENQGRCLRGEEPS